MDFVCIDRLQEGSFAAETVAVYFDGKFEDNVSYTLKDTPCGDVVGKTICCFDKDVRRLFPKDVVLQEMAAESYVGTTLWSSQGQPIGLIAVIGRKALTDTKLAASILQLVAVRAAGELERRRALDELKRLSNELEYKNEELESIIRIASHDLRSPLMNIKGFSGELSKEIGKVEEMLKEVTLPEKASQKIETVFTKYVPEAIGFIQGSADAINQMLASLTQVVRAGTVPLRMRDLDMNAILATITANVQFKLRETVAELTVEPLPGCRGDADQIAQVFTNLIENAIKYREPSRPLRIQVYASAEPGKVTYCVEDNGKGIAEEHRNTVFDLFARLDPEATKGEGLGLTIAKRMVERQGGKIWVSSEPGKGAKFFVTLPK
jgi:signal transduction histidine kinase